MNKIMITYTWEYPNFKTKLSENGFTNVVKAITWRLTATDGEYTAIATSEIPLPTPDEGMDFTDIEDITKEWCMERLMESPLFSYDALLESLKNEIENKKSPPIVSVVPSFHTE